MCTSDVRIFAMPDHSWDPIPGVIMSVLMLYAYILSFFILIDYPIHIDTTSMESPILYFKGLPVKFSIKCCISVPEDCFQLRKQCRH